MLRLEEVSTPEMAEVLAINALAPAVINGRLKGFMQAAGPPASTPAPEGGGGGGGEEEGAAPTAHSLKFIVNVSAMEGRFYKCATASALCSRARRDRTACTTAPAPAEQLAEPRRRPRAGTSSRRTRTRTWRRPR